MRFSTRLLLCSVIPAGLFVAALTASLWGLFRTQHEFDQYLGTEQATANGVNEMYAQGLQMGQALRNIVLDPANPQGLRQLRRRARGLCERARDTVLPAGGTALGAGAGTAGDVCAKRRPRPRQARVMPWSRPTPRAAAQAQQRRDAGLAPSAGQAARRDRQRAPRWPQTAHQARPARAPTASRCCPWPWPRSQCSWPAR